MTNPNAFSFGAQERNYWADRLDPAKEAERNAKRDTMEAEHRRMIQAHAQEQQRQAVLTQSGPAIVEIIKAYDAYERPTPAKTSEVQGRFSEQFPDAAPGEFRNALEELKAIGVIREVTSSIGFMGARDTNLHFMG